MPVADSDIAVYATYSTKFHSIGGNPTSSKIVFPADRFRITERDEYVHNLYQQIWPGDITNARKTYRCVAIKNESSETWYSVKAWIVNSDAVQSEITIKIAKAVASPPEQVGSEYEAPSTEVFSSPIVRNGDPAAIDFGDISTNGYAYLWIERAPSADAKSRSYETVLIRVEGKTESGASTYCGVTMVLSWHTLTEEISECLQRLQGIPEGRINLRGAQEFYDDSMFIVERLANPNVDTATKNRVTQSRAMYLIYQEYTVELERAGGGLPPMVVSRVYELRRVMNEMFNLITGSTTRPDIQALKTRSWRGRSY